MKTYTIYKSLLIGLLFIIATLANAQTSCPFTATITTIDAGGCGNANGGVYFTYTEETPGSIEKAYYLVYKDNVLFGTSDVNVNPKVSNLPVGNYVAEVQVHCKSGTQDSWREAFTIKKSTAGDVFKAAYWATSSRLNSLAATPTGMLHYTFSEGTGPYTLDITQAPAGYVGPKHFEGITNGGFKLERLAPGTYSVRMSNGCMDIDDRGREILLNSNAPLPSSANIIERVTTKNTQSGVNSTKPTTDYNTIYYTLRASYFSENFWFSTQYYETAIVYRTMGEAINASTVWTDLVTGEHKITTKYSIGEMLADEKKIPTVYVRLKNTDLVIYSDLWLVDGGGVTLSTDDYNNCGSIVNLDVNYASNFTYPLNILVYDYLESKLIDSHIITDADMKSEEVVHTFANFDMKDGYSVYFESTGGDPHPFKGLVAKRQKVGSLAFYDFRVRKEETLNTEGIDGDMCGGVTYTYTYTNKYHTAQLYFNTSSTPNEELYDLRGASITYTGATPLPAGVKTSFTIPTSYEKRVTYLDLLMPEAVPGFDPDAAGSYRFALTENATHSWKITHPCLPTGSTTVSYTSPEFSKDKTTTSGVSTADVTKFNPTLETGSTCGFAVINLGKRADLKSIMSITDEDGVTKNKPAYITLYTKLSAEMYFPVSSGSVVYPVTPSSIGGGIVKYMSTDQLKDDMKIKIPILGTYYLIASHEPPPLLGFNAATRVGCTVVAGPFVLTEANLSAQLKASETGAYFCAQDKSTGVLFATREGSNTGDMFTFNVWNQSRTFEKEIKTAETQISLKDIDTKKYGTTFNISLEADGCTSTPHTVILDMNTIDNSATFLSQDIGSNCSGSVDVMITATAFASTSYLWKDIDGNILGNTNVLKRKLPTGTKLQLEVTFPATGPTGQAAECSVWTVGYVVEGTGFTDFYWRSNAKDSNWNDPANWNKENGKLAGGVPAVCSNVFIPATVTKFYPDLATASPAATVSNIYFEYGAQLYNQHKLVYEKAYISYNFGYYKNLPSTVPTSIVQPTSSANEVTASAVNKAPVTFASLPTLTRSRWYMLSTPLKGMYSGDFQLAGKPFVIGRNYTPAKALASNLISEGFVTSPANDKPLSSTNKAISIWIPSYGDAIGAEDQSVLEDLKGVVWYPYFLSTEIMNKLPDSFFDETASTMSIKRFEMEKSDNLSDPFTFTYSDKSARFVYENDATDAIPAGDIYTMSVAVDIQQSSGEVMIGNPFMAPIDFDKFVAANAGVIGTSYKLIVNGETKTYDTTNPGAAGSLSKYIAAQQSFIITLANPKVATSLKFPVSVIAAQDSNTIKVKVQ